MNTLVSWLVRPKKNSGTSDMDVLARNNVQVSGRGDRAMVFAHGFGCDQNMWRFVAPEFEGDFKVVLFDHVGAGGSDLSAYDKSSRCRHPGDEGRTPCQTVPR